MGFIIFQWEITFGESLAIFLTLLGVVWGLWKAWLRKYPFSIYFYENPWDTEFEQNPHSNWKIIDCKSGEPIEITVGLKLRIQQNFHTVDWRLQKRDKLFWWKPPPKGQVEIIGFHDPDPENPPFKTDESENRTRDNKKGGRVGTYSSDPNIPKGAIVWYVIKLKSYINWNGYLSFQLRRGDSHRGLARLPLCFKITDS